MNKIMDITRKCYEDMEKINALINMLHEKYFAQRDTAVMLEMLSSNINNVTKLILEFKTSKVFEIISRFSSRGIFIPFSSWQITKLAKCYSSNFNNSYGSTFKAFAILHKLFKVGVLKPRSICAI